ncbi:ROK family transcriptional regulator [Olivibacter ginsenosidimutans]|uniref:ROK family transcriptional regulator n=1 Tax=Olivibacter ginsenosidimutans TaxID=1176537 RepID=A0ABP9BCM6_9SPHI
MKDQTSFLQQIHHEEYTGVAYKNVELKKQILSFFANEGSTTLADLSKELNISIPKINELVVDLIQDGLVKDYGKSESNAGRKPNLYGLRPNSAFFIGVEVKNYHLNIGLMDFKKNFIKVEEGIPFLLQNTPQSLVALCDAINAFMANTAVAKSKILGIGITLMGRINYKSGYSYNYFNFNEKPLTKVIEEKIGLHTFLENDSRAMAYAEFNTDIVKNEKNVLFLNIDRGIGTGIMTNGQLYYGKSGFAGEFGHIPMFDNEIICYCGKKGCLETEVSGRALRKQFISRLKNGEASILTRDFADPEDIQLEDIIQAAIHDDTLAIELIANVGEKLGKGIALLMNLFNPELVVLGGILSTTGDYLFLPVKSAINKYSLSLVHNDTHLKLSKLGDKAGILGACLLVRNRLLGLLK